MSDLVDRQAAIDHWRLIIDATNTDSRYNMGFVDGLEFCISHLSTMPSTQPEITPDGTLNVTVDADIANVGRILLSQTGTQRGGLYYKDEQPEIIMCKDCKHYRKEHGWNCIEYTVCAISPIHTVIRKPDDYCSRSERRTDECTN